MLKKFFQFFVPKDKIFFALFEKVAINSHEMAKKLAEMVSESDPQKHRNYLAEIERIEHENDSLTHEIFVELGKNFITPLDREDIYYLATTLDDVADLIHSCAKRIVLYKINTNDITIRKMSDLIKTATDHKRMMILELRKMNNIKAINEGIVRINSVENQADDIYDISVEALFANESDIKELIKKREIYSTLEKVTDACEDVANVVETIIIKYS